MANDYISREDAKDALQEKVFHNLTDEFYGAMQVLDELPPADVVQVVRCKDCKWATKSTELPGWYMCKCEEAFDYYAKPDDFCSYGERKE